MVVLDSAFYSGPTSSVARAMEIFGFSSKNPGLKEHADAKPIITETTATN